MEHHSFFTTCTDSYAVGSYGEAITEMTQSSHMEELDNSTFFQTSVHAGFQDYLLDLTGSKKDFIHDWSISCHRSLFQGVPCFYLRHSGIEHIFVQQSMMTHLRTGDELLERIDHIDALHDAIFEDPAFDTANTDAEVKLALVSFLHQNYSTMSAYRIPMASLFAYATPYADIAAAVDREYLFSPERVMQHLSIELGWSGGDFSQHHALIRIEQSLSECFQLAMSEHKLLAHNLSIQMQLKPNEPTTAILTMAGETLWPNDITQSVVALLQSDPHLHVKSITSGVKISPRLNTASLNLSHDTHDVAANILNNEHSIERKRP